MTTTYKHRWRKAEERSANLERALLATNKRLAAVEKRLNRLDGAVLLSQADLEKLGWTFAKSSLFGDVRWIATAPIKPGSRLYGQGKSREFLALGAALSWARAVEEVDG